MPRNLSELPPSEQVFQLDYWQVPIDADRTVDGQALGNRGMPHLGIGPSLYHDAVQAYIDTLTGKQEVSRETTRGMELNPITRPRYFNQPGTVLLIDVEKLYAFNETSGDLFTRHLSEMARRRTEQAVRGNLYLGEPAADDIVSLPAHTLVQQAYRETDPIIKSAHGGSTNATSTIISEEHKKFYTRSSRVVIVGIDKRNRHRFFGGFVNEEKMQLRSHLALVLGPLVLGETTSRQVLGLERPTLSRLRDLAICYTPATAPVPAKANRRLLGRFAFGNS